MIFEVKQNYLVNSIDSLSWDSFVELTGSKINLKIRVGKKIHIDRESGHVFFSDTEFIVGEKYRKDTLIYRCKYVNRDGIALLSTLNNKLYTVTSNKSLEFRIVL